MKTKHWFLLTIIAFLILLSTGCGSNESTPSQEGKTAAVGTPQQEAKHDPVTLTFTRFNQSGGQEQLDKYMKPFIEKKFPWITLQYVGNEDKNKFDDLVAAGTIPDIVMTGYAKLQELSQKDFPLDLTGLVKKYNFDLNQYEKVPINTAKSHSTKGQLNALPISVNTFALFYNKDLFDKFGVSYPKDGMTWEEIVDLTRKVSRTDGGQQYSGLQYSNNNANFARGIALPLVNPQMNKAAFNTDAGLRVLNTLKEIYSIPNNESQGKVLERFTSGLTAMIPWWAQATIQTIQEAADGGKSMNFDLTSYPHFSGFNGYFEPSTGMYTISKTSKHPDEAFQVISYLTTDPEVQGYAAQFGDLPVIPMKDLDKKFGSSFKVLKGKNVAGMLKGQFLDNHPPSLYDDIASKAFNKYSGQFLKGDIPDARTALAKAEEETNKSIAEAMGQ